MLFGAMVSLTLAWTLPAYAQEPSPTPTYDPLIEPVLPENPTEMELGRNLYWHWCMTCHGDQGQGLTDEWRAVWEEDHQNCWARGCHAGNNGKGDEVFVIPTVVPLIIGENHLEKYENFNQLAEYLELTHPPQHPGILSHEEYRVIAGYVFTQNGRTLLAATITPAPVLSDLPTTTATLLSTKAAQTTQPAPSPSAVSEKQQLPSIAWKGLIIILGVVGLIVFLSGKLKGARH
jgi:hypothetical protein